MRYVTLAWMVGAGCLVGPIGLAATTKVAQTAKRTRQSQTKHAPEPWMKCVAQATLSAGNSPGISAGVSSIPSNIATTATATPTPAPGLNAIRIVFTQEPANGDEISADTFQIDESGKTVKQIGHSELLGNSSSSSVELQSTDDSPFAFSLSVQQTSSEKTAQATINSAALFSGQIISQASARCRIYSGTDSSAEDN